MASLGLEVLGERVLVGSLRGSRVPYEWPCYLL